MSKENTLLNKIILVWPAFVNMGAFMFVLMDGLNSPNSMPVKQVAFLEVRVLTC